MNIILNFSFLLFFALIPVGIAEIPVRFLGKPARNRPVKPPPSLLGRPLLSLTQAEVIARINYLAHVTRLENTPIALFNARLNLNSLSPITFPGQIEEFSCEDQLQLALNYQNNFVCDRDFWTGPDQVRERILIGQLLELRALNCIRNAMNGVHLLSSEYKVEMKNTLPTVAVAEAQTFISGLGFDKTNTYFSTQVEGDVGGAADGQTAEDVSISGQWALSSASYRLAIANGVSSLYYNREEFPDKFLTVKFFIEKPEFNVASSTNFAIGVGLPVGSITVGQGHQTSETVEIPDFLKEYFSNKLVLRRDIRNNPGLVSRPLAFFLQYSDLDTPSVKNEMMEKWNAISLKIVAFQALVNEGRITDVEGIESSQIRKDETIRLLEARTDLFFLWIANRTAQTIARQGEQSKRCFLDLSEVFRFPFKK